MTIVDEWVSCGVVCRREFSEIEEIQTRTGASQREELAADQGKDHR